MKRTADWWQLADTTGLDKVYWIQYDPRQPGLDTGFRLLVVKGKQAYIITSGHFNPSTTRLENPELDLFWMR